MQIVQQLKYNVSLGKTAKNLGMSSSKVHHMIQRIQRNLYIRDKGENQHYGLWSSGFMTYGPGPVPELLGRMGKKKNWKSFAVKGEEEMQRSDKYASVPTFF